MIVKIGLFILIASGIVYMSMPYIIYKVVSIVFMVIGYNIVKYSN